MREDSLGKNDHHWRQHEYPPQRGKALMMNQEISPKLKSFICTLARTRGKSTRQTNKSQMLNEAGDTQSHEKHGEEK